MKPKKATGERITFGEFFKAQRIASGKTLREFCLERGYDPGNLSKLERGLLSPPQAREKLEEYAKALKLREGTDGWYVFFDLAAAETGRIPEDLRDEDLVKKLPVIFRTLRGRKLTDEQLDQLVERLRKE
jgi:transcriptional regulator with XRE-family HTH domain